MFKKGLIKYWLRSIHICVCDKIHTIFLYLCFSKRYVLFWKPIHPPLGLLSSIIFFHYQPQLDIQVKIYYHFTMPRDSLCNSECLDILWASNVHPSKTLWSFEFSMCFTVEFQVPRYIMGLNQNVESNVMADWICQRLACSISTVSINYGPPLDIRVKSYGWLDMLEDSLSKYECLDILWASIGHLTQMLWIFEFSMCFIVEFRALWYIAGLNQNVESNFMVVWIF